jgi:hypothetical protein
MRVVEQSASPICCLSTSTQPKARVYVASRGRAGAWPSAGLPAGQLLADSVDAWPRVKESDVEHHSLDRVDHQLVGRPGRQGPVDSHRLPDGGRGGIGWPTEDAEAELLDEPRGSVVPLA